MLPRNMTPFRRITLLLALALACAASAASAARAASAATWTNEAYAWQRQPAPAALDAALENTRTYLDAYCFLAAEVTFDKTGAPKITRVPLDYAKLAAFSAANHKPIALALRIGTLSTPKQFAAFQPALAALAAELLATARAAKLDPAELQLDFDCPESRLDLYRDWLVALRPALGKTPLAFTALPSWLNNAGAFAALVRAADSFILQVHSLEKPDGIHDHIRLCDPDTALRDAARANDLAARAGVRFRVALPTYGYTLGFNAIGLFVGIAAETWRDWPAGTQLRTVRSDPLAMQSLAQQLEQLAAKKLSNATGIIWFRLPVEGDRLAWPADTLAAVIQNNPIVTRLTAEVHCAKPGLAEIVVINQGQTVEQLPERLHVTWTRGFGPVSHDALAGYYFYGDNAEGDNTLIATCEFIPGEIAPGQTRVIGWIRFDFPDTATAENFSIHATIP